MPSDENRRHLTGRTINLTPRLFFIRDSPFSETPRSEFSCCNRTTNKASLEFRIKTWLQNRTLQKFVIFLQ